MITSTFESIVFALNVEICFFKSEKLRRLQATAVDIQNIKDLIANAKKLNELQGLSQTKNYAVNPEQSDIVQFQRYKRTLEYAEYKKESIDNNYPYIQIKTCPNLGDNDLIVQTIISLEINEALGSTKALSIIVLSALDSNSVSNDLKKMYLFQSKFPKYN